MKIMRPKVGGASLPGCGTFPPVVNDYQPLLAIRVSGISKTWSQRCKSNSDHEFELNGRESQYSFHDCLLTRAPRNHDFHNPRLSPAVLKTSDSNAILRVPGPPPCASARPAPAAAAGTRLTGRCPDTAGGKGQRGWSLSMSSQCSSTH